jgi:hypothetical protein
LNRSPQSATAQQNCKKGEGVKPFPFLGSINRYKAKTPYLVFPSSFFSTGASGAGAPGAPGAPGALVLLALPVLLLALPELVPEPEPAAAAQQLLSPFSRNLPM